LRFLFCLTSSLLSGSAVAVLFTAIMQHAFPDAAENPTAPLVNLAAVQHERSVQVPPKPEPATGPSPTEIQSAPLSRGVPDPGVLEVATDPAAHQNPLPVLPSNARAVAQQRHPELTALTEEAAQDRGQLLAASVATHLLAERTLTAEASEAAPGPQTQPDKLASVAQPTPLQERDPVVDSTTQRNTRDHKRTVVASPVAEDTHVRAAAGGAHPTRSRLMTHASHAGHAHRRQASRSGDHRAPSQQHQQQAQE
jgi:hypothetical protein